MINLTKEDKVHLYVINKSLLSENDIAEIENKINSDDAFKEFVENVKLVIKDIEIFDTSKLDMAELTAKILNKNKIQFLFELKPLFSDDKAEDLKLAAMQKKDATENFVYFNTYASAENLILVRVLKNVNNNAYRFFVLTEDSKITGYSVLKINKSRMEFIADEKGMVNFQSDHLHKNIELSVLLPIDIFSVDLNQPDKIYYSETPGKSMIKFERDKDNLTITFEKDYTADKTIYAVFDNDYNGYLKFQDIKGNILTIENSKKNTSNIKIISVSSVN